MSYIAKTFYGLESLLVDELIAIGAENIVSLNRAVSFDGSLETLYRANLECRTAIRILQPIHEFKARNEKALYRHASRYAWEELIDVEQTFAIDHAVRSEYFTHSKYVALKTKDAIVDRIRNVKGARPSVNTDMPDFRLNVHLNQDHFNISLDSSGFSLYKRDYRDTQHEAPINEVLASALIKFSGWDGKQPLLDPMCGSGTIPIEASMIANNIPPGIFNEHFAFMNWADYDEELWNKVRNRAIEKITESESDIYASDINPASDDDLSNCIDLFNSELNIYYQTADFLEMKPPAETGIIIMNPPYGERLKQDEINEFYKEIGNKLKREYAGWQAWILSSNVQALKRVGLKPSKKIMLYNGALECRFHRFDLYDGSKKASKN